MKANRVALLMLVSAGLIAAAVGCSNTENAFEAARALEQTSIVQASTPRAPTPVGGGSVAGDGGHAARGQSLFTQQGCSACHSTGANTIVGPGLASVGDRAATRVSGPGARDYLRQSIISPASFLVPGFNNLMPGIFASLPQQDIDDLIAYLETLK